MKNFWSRCGLFAFGSLAACGPSGGAPGASSGQATQPEEARSSGPSGGADAGCGAPAPACVPNGSLRVFAWGANTFAEVAPNPGDPTALPTQQAVPTPTPVSLPAGVNIVMVAAGDTHNLALDDQGNVWAWGANACGELGVEPADAASDSQCFLEESSSPSNLPFDATPQKVPGLKGVKSIAAGMMFSMALLETGEVMTWGYNLAGTLGDHRSNYGAHWTPQLVTQADGSALPPMTRIYAGAVHAIAVAANGTVWGWGSNYQGQLGLDPTVYGPSGSYGPYPIPPTALGAVHSDASGVTAGGLHSYFIDDGSAWGFGSYWNPGAGGAATTSTSAIDIVTSDMLAGSSVREVAAGGYFGLALGSRGEVWSWGDQEGELGYPTGTGPATVPGLPPIAHVWAGYLSGFAEDTSGQLWGWGFDTYGELGVAPANATGSPAVVPGIVGVTAFSSFGESNLAIGYACAPPAPLTVTVTAALPPTIVTFDGNACLPTPPDGTSGSASGGVAPYTYAWTVSVLNADGSVRAGPESIGDGATASTGAIAAPSWYPSLDPVLVQSTGERVVFTVTATDATGAQATASETVNWQCGPS